MEPDVRAFVNSCRTCAQCKDPVFLGCLAKSCQTSGLNSTAGSGEPSVGCWGQNAAYPPAHRVLLSATAAQKQYANKRRRPAPTYRPGQQDWLSANQDLPLRVNPCKLTPRYIGPFKVLRRVNPVSYRLTLPPLRRVHPTFHVSRLRPVLCSLGPFDLPGPRMVDGAPAYTVKRILDVRQVGVQYTG
ncbi:hypothetical protein P4O66_001950 [Electrophorus voltai]|uniref:Tf2-1-like SH3-like domain-containing protein n=1 Tax=Electrophorus voltai TaxID=2609070 RepID=A0AAD8ZVP2_9TELE|nr:hypothetical protein P4O66_001950 [Electrophorus voltai]